MSWLTTPEGRDLFALLLPIFWAILAAVIALVLYKSSKSLLEGVDLPGVPLKGLRLAGSAVIFVVVFLLLKTSTTIHPGQSTSVAESDLIALRASAERLEAGSVTLLSCTRLQDGTQGCEQHAEQLRSEAETLMRLTDRIRPAD